MKRIQTFSAVIILLLSVNLSAQNISSQLDKSVKQLLGDSQMKHASIGFYVIDAATGKSIYNLNSQTGLAAASTQKIFTAIAAFDLLGKDFRYKTEIGYDGKIENNILNGNLFIVGFGDPTFGSWRYAQTKRDVVLNKIIVVIKNAGIEKINGDIILDDSKFSYQPLPGGWIWDDIGNYYGAGTWAINWNENQYDLVLQPGENEGDNVKIISVNPEIKLPIINQMKTGAKGSGDNGYIYMPPYSTQGFIKGTEAASAETCTISGSLPYPVNQLGDELLQIFSANKINVTGKILTDAKFISDKKNVPSYQTLLDTYYSPILDSIIYWFLKRSINLYGEAMAKTIAYQKTELGSTEKGIELIQQFWQQHGIETTALNMMDGSGLSPENRVTTDAEVTALRYAQSQSWFNSFYNSLPVINDMKMKSGSIGGSRAFAGYQTSKGGHQYIFSIIINNFSGSANEIVKKMFAVLDNLK